MRHKIIGFNEAYVKVGEKFTINRDPSQVEWVVVRYDKPNEAIVERADGVKMTPEDIEAYYEQLE